MTHIDMTKPFSSNPKLEHWVPSEQQIQTITAAREILDLVPEEEGDSTNAYTINALNVQSHLHPEVIASQQLVDDTRVHHSDRLLPLSCQTAGRELMPKQTTAPRFLRLSEVLQMTGMGKTFIYDRINDGTFPKQIQLGSRTVVWNEQEVTKWMEDRMASR